MSSHEEAAPEVAETCTDPHPPQGVLDGQVAIVTGGARGIGRAITERFAREGARVVVADLSADQRPAAVGTLPGAVDDRISFVACDVADPESVDRLFAHVDDRFGRLDVLVNNAALTTGVTHLLETDESWWNNYLAVNLQGPYSCTVRAARRMAQRGRGAIINVSSVGATRAHRGLAAYDASKGGIEAFTRSAALELAPYGVRVNALVPGFIETNPREPQGRGLLRKATVPLERGGVPDDMAGPALFLVSDDAAYVTGACLVVDGGVSVQQRSPQVEVMPPSTFPRIGSRWP